EPPAGAGAAPVAPSPAGGTAQGAAPAEDWVVQRGGGDMEIVATWDAGRGWWRSGNSVIDTPLSAGYPPPTPPAAIDVKKYPAVRRAAGAGGGRDTGSASWPLFKHIERNGIAMTSPAEYDYPGTDPDAPRIG